MLGDIFLWLKTRLLTSQNIHPTTPTYLSFSYSFHFISFHSIAQHITSHISFTNALYTSQYLSFLTAMVLQLDCFENLIAGANDVFSFYFPYGHEVTKIWEGEWIQKPSAFLKTMFSPEWLPLLAYRNVLTFSFLFSFPLDCLCRVHCKLRGLAWKIFI
jgi:hypothetical protein